MSNINDDFEEYWETKIKLIYGKDIYSNKNIKEICRFLYVDIIVTERVESSGKKTDK
jgi:hypothetical protein